MERSIYMYISRSIRKAALRVALSLSTVIFVIGLLLGKSHYEKNVQSFLATHAQNFAFWVQVGDIFQIDRSVSHFDEIEGLDFIVANQNYKVLFKTQNLYEIPENAKDITPGESKIGFSRGKITFTAHKELKNIGHLYAVQSLPLLVVLVSFLGLLVGTFLISNLILKSFGKTARRLSKPIENLSGEIEKSEGLNQIQKIDYSSEQLQEIKVLKRTLSSFANQLITAQEEQVVYEKAKASRNLAKQVAHDLRSPISFLEFSVEENDVDGIKKAVDRLKKVSNDLLDKNKDPLRKTESVNLTEVCSSLVNEKSFSGKVLRFDSVGRDLYVKSQGDKLLRVLSNLLNNAFEAIDDDGEVKMILEEFDSYARISIKDNGKGIPKDVIDNIGQQGYSYGKELGNGLGIHYAKSCVQNWSGAFRIESECGVGTTVVVEHQKDENQERIPIVHLDDDILIRKMWEKRFIEKKIDYIQFDSPAELLTSVDSLPLNTKFFIDEDLGKEKMRGHEVCKKLSEKSFYNLFLSTGYESQEFSDLTYISSVVGKDFPL